MNTLKTLIIAASVFLSAGGVCSAQTWSVGTNAGDWLALGTINAEAGVSVARHLTVTAGARLNPWTFRGNDPQNQVQYRQQTYNAGLRYWPWYVYSGWWLGAGGQYQEYNRGGITGRTAEEGDAWGATLSGGYTMMLHRNLNVEFGASLFGGYALYTTYACPQCGKVTDAGTKWFVIPNSLIASLIWVF